MAKKETDDLMYNRILLAANLYYKNHFSRLWVGTSESGVGYYERYGFVRDHVVKNFFTNNYPEPIIDNGIPCVDMTYLYLEIR